MLHAWLCALTASSCLLACEYVGLLPVRRNACGHQLQRRRSPQPSRFRLDDATSCTPTGTRRPDGEAGDGRRCPAVCICNIDIGAEHEQPATPKIKSGASLRRGQRRSQRADVGACRRSTDGERRLFPAPAALFGGWKGGVSCSASPTVAPSHASVPAKDE
jgi:hypothetical protein